MTSRLSSLTALLFATTLAGASAARSLAATPEATADEARDRALCERVLASPVSLGEALRRATAGGRVALAAGFALEGEAGLTLTVATVGPGEEAHDFVEVSGPVRATGWDAQDRALTEVGAVARAARSQTLLAQGPATLEDAVRALGKARRPKEGSPTGVAIAVRVVRVDGRTLCAGQVALEGTPWRVGVNLAPQVSLVGLDPPPYVAEREEAARRWLGKRLPALEIAGARWLNVEVPPTWEGLRGHPVLVLLTNVNCEMELGPAPDVVTAWERRYGPLGLRVLTLYRDRASWKQEVPVEGLPEHVRASQTTHPVMIDMLDRYIEALEPGPVGYPVAYVLNPEGVVVWESATGRLDFVARCETALLEVLAPKAPPSGPRAPGR